MTDAHRHVPTDSIGVFDSGVGGLSVLREIRATLPCEQLLYVADSGAAPYGERTQEFIKARAVAIVEFFLQQRVKAIVVACNTATAVAIKSLRSRYAIPMVAIEPAIKPAAMMTKSGVVGVLATTQTLASENLVLLAEKYGKGVKILSQACPGWVEQVELGRLNDAKTESLVVRYVTPLLERGADTIVLGCTHYPFLLASIRHVAGSSITFIDPAVAVARELGRRLELNGLLSLEKSPGAEAFWTSGVPQQVELVIAQLWGKQVIVEPLPARYSAPNLL